MGIFLPLVAGTANALEVPIGVNFSVDAANNLDATEAAGAPEFTHANWNNLGRWGDPTALKDKDGVTTPVTLKWDATATYFNDANAALGGNYKLMKSYLDSNSAAITEPFNGVFGGDDDKPSILVTGVDTWMTQNGFTSFAVVIYSDGDVANGQRAARVWLAGTNTGAPVNGDPGLGPDLTNRVDIIDGSNFGANPKFTRVTGTGGIGNYTAFNGLKAGAFYIRLDEAGAQPYRCPINGLQIVGFTGSDTDADGDGLPNAWEDSHGLNANDNGSISINNGPAGDPDGDGRTNLQEFTAGTDPSKADTDGDGLNDGAEFTAGTNPLLADTDGDGLPDGWEVAYSLNPLDNGAGAVDNGAIGDPDHDLLSNALEFARGTSPRDTDTDHDGYSDLVEDNTGIWVSISSTGTSPIKADTDHDGIPDGQENPDAGYLAGVRSGTNPNLADTDGDGANDRWEFLLGKDPTLAGSNIGSLVVKNGSFEQPDVNGTFVTGVPTDWTLVGADNAGNSFVENKQSVQMTGSDGLQYAGVQKNGAYIYQDTGAYFAPDTTYIVDVAGAYRLPYGGGHMEFGLASSTAVDQPVGIPGKMDQGGVVTASGNPDADNVQNTFRDASVLQNIGSGKLGQPHVFSTRNMPPSGTIVVYIRHIDGFRVSLDNVRILAVPNSVDADGDGLPDAWELANRLDPTSAAGDNGAAGDADNDGATNLQEWLGGTNPHDGLSYPAPDPVVVTSSGFNGSAFDVAVKSLTPVRRYQLFRSTDLVTFNPIGEVVTGVSQHTFSDVTPPAKAAFYRVQLAPAQP